MYFYAILLGLFFSPLFGMMSNDCQLDMCPTRKAYQRPQIITNNKESVQLESTATKQICVFCDSKILETNHIISEDKEHDVRVMMNKFPYCDFDQGRHLLLMPISHKEHPNEFSHNELAKQGDAVQKLSAQLYDEAYTQEYFINWGKISGQSQPHFHGQFKSYIKAPMSLPERMESQKNSQIKTTEQAFEAVKIVLESAKNISVSSQQATLFNDSECNCCNVKNNADNDENNFVIARFKHNYICLSHHPRWPGEIAIVPNNHVASLKDLSQEALQENMILAMALLPKMREYAHEHIRECDGGNVFIKSMGNKASNKKKSKYHVHTLIIPRTTVPLIPGSMDGNSTKIDCDPLHLFEYLKNQDDLKIIIT